MCKVTESQPKIDGMSERNVRLLHAGMGLCTESSEFLDQLKKVIFYGREADIPNLIEELGDLSWYLAIAADELGVSFEQIFEGTINKLKARYLRWYKCSPTLHNTHELCCRCDNANHTREYKKN